MGVCNCISNKKQQQKATQIQHHTSKIQYQNSDPQQSQNLLISFTIPSQISRLIQTQSLFKSYLTRKLFSYQIRNQSVKADQDLQFLDPFLIPNHMLSLQAKQIYQKLAPYNFNYSNFKPTRLVDGSIYLGQWNSYMEPEGIGVIFYQDGGICQGHWKEGRLNGPGKRISPSGDLYIGQFKNGRKTGFGKITFYISGNTYQGEWLQDLQDGKGYQQWPDGSKFNGEFKQGCKTGKGKFIWADSSSYQGDFLRNEIQGYGKYIWNNGRQYEGSWSDNKMHGKGLFKWSDGRFYQGEYVYDQKEGWGVFVWPNGKKYEGQWHNGKQHGQGTLFNEKGRARKGIWENGKLQRGK